MSNEFEDLESLAQEHQEQMHGTPYDPDGMSGVADSTTAPDPVADKGAGLRKMLLPMLIGTAVLGFGGYKIYGLMAGPASPEVAPMAMAPAPVAAPVPPAGMPDLARNLPAPPPAVAATASGPATPPTSGDSVMAAAAAAAQAQETPAQSLAPSAPGVPTVDATPAAPAPTCTQSADIQALQARIERMEARLADLSAIDQKLDRLLSQSGAPKSAAATPSVSAPVTVAKAPKKSRYTPARRHVAAHKPVGRKIAPASPAVKVAAAPAPETVKDAPGLQLQAVVPGRAWLRTRAGETLTVAVGDSLPDGVRVTAIDAKGGEVRTSSGVVR